MTSTPHLLHVSCFVRDEGGLWHLLRGLEAHGVHGVEVKPVTPDAEAVLTGRPVTAPMLPAEPVHHVLMARDPPRPARTAGRKKRINTANMRSAKKDELSRSMIIAQLDAQEARSLSEVARRSGMPLKQVANFLYRMAREGTVIRPEFGLYLLVRRPAGARS